MPQKANFCGLCGARLNGVDAPPYNPAEASRGSGPLGPGRPGTGELVAGNFRPGTGSLAAASPRQGASTLTEGADGVPVGDRRVVTVLFTDVSGFTSMSERLDPEEVREVVNSFFKVLVEPIYRFGGVVDKYIGDAIMAVFGAPVAHEDDAERAVMAAWTMQNAAKAFSAKMKPRIGTELKVRIGLNTGLVVAGAVGGDQKQDYTVLGDAVNLAQRMESSAKPGDVLVTHETQKATAQRFEYADGVPIKVKGRKEAAITYVLLGPRDPGSVYRDRLPMIGRDDEMSQLRVALGRALNESPQAINLVGDAGMGKSRLCREFATDFADRGLGRLVTGRALSYAEDTPNVLLQSIIADTLGVPARPQADEVIGRARNLLERLGGPDEVAVALLAAAMGVDHPQAPRDPSHLREGQFASVSELLISLAKEAPLVVVLEDLQWADASSLLWLRDFLGRLEDQPELPLVVILQFRPSADKDFAEDVGPGRTRIEVGPLGSEDSWKLIHAVLDEIESDTLEAVKGSPARGVLEQIIRQADGNPLFVIELVTNLLENDALEKGAKGWEVHGVAGEMTLPIGLSGIIAARLDRLPPEQRLLLQVASVVGREFDAQLVASLMGMGDISQLAAELILADLVVIRENETYAFSQAVVQEVAYQSLLISTRRRLHGEVARFLESKGGADQPQVLARHYKLAEMPDKELRYLFLTGEKARVSHRIPEAILFGTQVLKRLEEPGQVAVVPLSRVLLSLGEAEMTGGQFASAQDHLEQARQRASNPLETASILLRLAEILERRGDFPAALARLTEAQGALSSQPDNKLHAQALAALASVRMRLGDHDEAIKLAFQGLALVSKDLPVEAGMCYSVLGVSYQRMGNQENAMSAHMRALALREQAGDLQGLAKSYNNLGSAYQEQGQWKNALECYSRALVLFKRVGDRGYLAMALNNLGSLHRERGELEVAEKHFREALQIARSLGDSRSVGWTLLGFGDLLLRYRRYREALAQVNEAISILDGIGLKDASEPYRLLGEIMLELGNRAEAGKALAEAERRASQATKRSDQAAVFRAISRFHELGGDLAKAENYSSRALELVDRRLHRLESARARAQQASVLKRLGRVDEADTLFAQASAEFEFLGAVPERQT